MHSCSVGITFVRTPSEADVLRQKLDSMDVALKRLTTKYLASQNIEKGLRKELVEERQAYTKLQDNLENSTKMREKVENQLCQMKVKFDSVQNRMMEITAPLKSNVQRL